MKQPQSRKLGGALMVYGASQKQGETLMIHGATEGRKLNAVGKQ